MLNGLRAKLEADITLTRVTIDLNARLDFDDHETHLVTVEGYLGHKFLWKEAEKQAFKSQFHARKDECEALETLLLKHIVKAIEPKED